MWMTLHLSILLFAHYQMFKPLFVSILFTRVKNIRRFFAFLPFSPTAKISFDTHLELASYLIY